MTTLLCHLPHHIAERARVLGEHPVREDGRFVLCWLHHAVRDHENPALDAALHLGNALGRPVLVYQGLGGRHRFNSDRHHTFIMEGARDLEAGLARRGIAYAFHLPEDTAAPSPLRALAERACVIVTEDFPAPPFPAWTEGLTRCAPCACIAVDAACSMPLRALDQRYTRAFRFRDAAEKAWRVRIHAPWPEVEPAMEPLAVDGAALGFMPVRLASADIPALCARCDIDHSLPPVGRIAGGSIAGYARWSVFREQHLRWYHKRRNDAADMDAVSGLSPWLHHGHVSPLRIAREADEVGGSGAEKFLDELLVWRELAFNFCAHTPSGVLESLDALPGWAAATLAAHAGDPRSARLSWETLARGATGDTLWDAAQRSLLRNGELHNNVRMTWGKMIPGWTATPAEALRVLIDLNHRFALDGSDPNSYGGLLWCLGQFDRSFSPERPILGSIRPRDTTMHATRLEPARYDAAVRAREGWAPLRIAVIGGGVSGLACARVIADQGSEAVVFDRGRAVGGRMSARRMHGPDDAQVALDHGAPYFTVHDARFGRCVRSWIADGVCARWEATWGRWDGTAIRTTEPEGPTIVGVPTMHAICAHLARDLDVRTSVAIERITGEPGAWLVEGAVDDRRIIDEPLFDAAVLAMPLEQAARILPPAAAGLGSAQGRTVSEPVWVCMLALDDDPAGLPDVLEIDGGGPVRLLVRDSAKPGRARDATGSVWVAHAASGWSRARYEVPREEIRLAMADAVRALISEITGGTVGVRHASAHRWGLARPAGSVRDACAFDADARVAVCGDGFRGGRVEGAFLSGHAAAGRVLALRGRRSPSGRAAEGTLFAGGSA